MYLSTPNLEPLGALPGVSTSENLKVKGPVPHGRTFNSVHLGWDLKIPHMTLALSGLGTPRLHTRIVTGIQNLLVQQDFEDPFEF